MVSESKLILLFVGNIDLLLANAPFIFTPELVLDMQKSKNRTKVETECLTSKHLKNLIQTFLFSLCSTKI